MKGTGTDEETLMRIIVSRCEIDLGGIKREYQDFYGKTLYDSVKKETSGDFKNALLALIGDAWLVSSWTFHVLTTITTWYFRYIFNEYGALFLLENH